VLLRVVAEDDDAVEDRQGPGITPGGPSALLPTVRKPQPPSRSAHSGKVLAVAVSVPPTIRWLHLRQGSRIFHYFLRELSERLSLLLSRILAAY
jgi:hypothetical protein